MSFLNPVNKSWCLEQICESNYQKIFQLIPDLCELTEKPALAGLGRAALNVRILEQSAHTLTIELNHHFEEKTDELALPAIKIRLYLDARMAEVLSDHARPGVTQVFKDFSLGREILNYKWRLNLFLHKWLDHCLAKGHYIDRQPVIA